MSGMKDVFEQLFPGMMLMWVCFIANGVFVDIFEEYKAHTVARLLASGVSLWEILVSKVLRCLIVCWVCEGTLILFTGVVFGVGWTNPAMLWVVLTAFNLFLLGFLSLVYGAARTTDSANAIVVFFLLMSAALGGSFMPFSELPSALQAIGQWSMIRLACVSVENLLQGKSAWAGLRPSLLLCAGGLILLGLGTGVLRRRFESGNTK